MLPAWRWLRVNDPSEFGQPMTIGVLARAVSGLSHRLAGTSHPCCCQSRYRTVISQGQSRNGEITYMAIQPNVLSGIALPSGGPSVSRRIKHQRTVKGSRENADKSPSWYCYHVVRSHTYTVLYSASDPFHTPFFSPDCNSFDQ